jgi:hypothetical protein
MLRLLAAASKLALISPAIAQDTSPAPSSQQPTPQEMPTPAPSSAPTDPAQPAPPTSPAPSSDTAAPAAPATPKSKEDTIKEVVSAEFPTYDEDKSGDLSKVEFGKWVTTLREQTMAQQGKATTMTDAEKASWVKNAFAKADADKSKKVSQAELETFLMG